jgi:hypothetical protein
MNQKKRSILSYGYFFGLISKPIFLTCIAFFIVMLTPLASFDNSELLGYIKAKGGNEAIQSLTTLFLISSFLERALEIVDSTFGGISSVKPSLKKLVVSWITFACGIIISAIGIRGLEPLMDLTDIPKEQINLFRLVDVMLTSIIISGGTEAVHKIFTSITAFLEATKKANTDKNQDELTRINNELASTRAELAQLKSSSPS